MQTTQDMPINEFELRPGDGWLFYKTGRDNTFVFQGHIKIHDTLSVQVVAKLDTTTHKYDCELREFDTWKTITKFELPEIGSNPFVDGMIRIPLDKPEEIDTPEGKLNLTHRKYKVRAFRDSKRKNVLRMQLPEVMKADRSINENAPAVPM